MNNVEIELGDVNNSCFVVMPFSSLFQIEYEKIIQPALTELNIQCIRGDEIYTKQRIVDDIWNSIKKCRFVLAELTDKNPNVLYEIGLAHAIGKPVIIITRNSEDVPFDLKALRYLFYDVNDPFWGENLKTGIQNLAKKVIENPNIEKYLDGINTTPISYPSISKHITPIIKDKVSFNISGTWLGEFQNEDNGIMHIVTLQINQNIDSLFGSAVISYTKSDKPTVVQEMMNGNIKKDNLVELHGVNYTYIERGNSEIYFLDTFKLEYNIENGFLSGKVISNMETLTIDTKIEFKKINSL